MSDQVFARLDQLSNAFGRIADHAPWVRARFIVGPGKLGVFVLGPPCEGNDDEGMIHGSVNPILVELYALTDQAGSLAGELWHSERYQGKFVSTKPIQYNLRQHRDWWLMVLLHTLPVGFYCFAKRSDGGKRPALTQIGESEIAVWIDNYSQVCVSALACLKAGSLAVPTVNRDQGRTGEKTTVDGIDTESLAIALLFKRPELSLSEIAGVVGVERQTLYKWPKFLEAAEATGKYKSKRSKEGNLPRGSKGTDGTIEAWRNPEREDK